MSPSPRLPRVTASMRATKSSLRSALGDASRVSDWAAMFRGELWDRPWQDVVRQWAQPLLAGYGGALTHGLIRTAHAIRAVETDGSPAGLLLDELANGLALWAATFRLLPGQPELRGPLTLAEAVGRLPRPTAPWPMFEAGAFSRIEELEGFPTAVDALGPPQSAGEALSSLSAQFCRVILAHPEAFAIPLVHTVTPIAAARILLPYLPPEASGDLYAQLWQVGAAITVSFTPAGSTPAAEPDADPGSPDELLARAIAHQDPHVLKFSEACAREYALNPDPVYLLAARHVLRQLKAW